MPPDLYATLGVSRNATKADIRKGYRAAAKRAHPDTGGSPEAFRRIQTAQLVLLDDARRTRYDQTGEFDEDRPVDIRQAQALEQLSFAIDIALANVIRARRDPREADMIAEVRTVLGDMRRKLEGQIAQYEAATTHWGKLCDRFTAKSAAEPNRMEAIVRGKCAQIAMMMAQDRARHESLKDADTILAAHLYRREEPAPRFDGPTMVPLSQLMGSL